MNSANSIPRTLLTVLFTLPLAAPAFAQADSSHAGGQNIEAMKFGMSPGMPSCLTGAVVDGDPSKGPSIILGKSPKGCSVPWHWHTPNERLMMVSGVARLEMKGGKPLTLRAGGFALMPSKHVHQFQCTATCLLYVYSDAAYDIHYVDAQEKEMSPEDALKAVKQTVSSAKH